MKFAFSKVVVVVVVVALAAINEARANRSIDI